MSPNLGGLINGFAPTPVADNKQINVTPGEYVVNVPATQKYKGLLEMINNEGKQMLAAGGWTGNQMGYANGGMIHTTPDELYNALQEDIDYVEEMIRGGASVADVANEYIGAWNLAPTDTTYETIGQVYDELLAANDAPGGYATDDTPIVASSNPKKKVASFAEREGLMFDPEVGNTLMQAVRGATEDWAALPDHEKAEWGSIDELIDYYLVDTATEEGFYDSHYKEDVAGYNQGGLITKIEKLVNHPMISEGNKKKLMELAKKDYAYGGRINPRANDPVYDPSDAVIDLNALRREIETSPNPGPLIDKLFDLLSKKGYWTGGEVGKGDPEEGDSITTENYGQLVFRNGNWTYSKSGAPAGKTAVSQGLKPFHQAEAAAITPSGLSEQSSNIYKQLADSGLKVEQSKNAGFGLRAIDAEKTIRDLENDPNFNPAGLAKWKQDKVGNIIGDLGQDEKTQQYNRAVLDFATAVLRKETGAVIADSEIEWVMKTYFPGLGTKDAKLGDLRKARADALATFMSGSGPGAQPLYDYAEEYLPGGIAAPLGEQGKRIFTPQDIGGLIGGSIGSIGGYKLGKKKGSAIGGAGGTYLGRAIADYFYNDKDVLESITPELNDLIDTAIGTIPGPAAGGLKEIWKSAAPVVREKILQKLSGKKLTQGNVNDVIQGTLNEVAEEGVAKTAAKGVSKLTGKASSSVLNKASKEGWNKVSHSGKDYFWNKNTGSWLDNTGKAVPFESKISKELGTKYNQLMRV